MRRARTCLEPAPVTSGWLDGLMMPWFVAATHPLAIASVAVGIALWREALGIRPDR